MLSTLRHGLARFRLRRGYAPLWRRYVGTVDHVTHHLRAETPLAKQLKATRIWAGRTGPKKRKERGIVGDNRRINITGEGLCDDILSYIGPSLERHRGCDLLDLYPGAGLWSRKLHDLLQPRSHVLMEPEPAVYAPFLEPLLSRPNVRLLPRVGIDWAALTQTLTPEFFSHQKEHSFHSPDAVKRNDTLLVTANLSLFPPRRFQQFASVAQLVLYQLISAIRTSSLFQKYGLVRMLIWVQDADKKSILPHLIQGRTRVAAEAELATEWLHEVAAYDPPPEDDQSRFSRSADIDRDSLRQVAKRMQDSGVATPPGRETRRLQAMLDGENLEDAHTPSKYGTRQIVVSEWQGLEARLAAGELDDDPALLKRVKYLRSRINWEALRQQKIDPLLAEGSTIAALKAAGDQSAETAAREAAWIAAIDGLEVSLRKQFRMYRDNQHVFHQTPPVLHWDRRAYEPLTLNPVEELFPNVPCTLLDIQPKAMEPLFRQFGPGSSRAGDYFEALLKIIWSTESQELQAALNRVWMGAGDSIVPQMASLRDPSRGGIDLGGYGGEMVPRILNADQLHELLERWMEWPFKPGYMEFIGRTSEGESDVDDEGASRTMVGGDAF